MMEKKSINLLKSHYDKKQHLLATIDTVCEYGWITIEQANEIKARIESNVLTIGVIGQMKSGKSTFLNTFVFEDDILPSATTPMTAALSIITYGEKKGLEAEFYTKEEWEEQKALAQSHYDESQAHSIKAAKIKAARELVGNNRFSESELDMLLGKTQKNDISQLVEYVGAKGKYVAITKAVRIYYPAEYLKGVEIVDTPGFNDPIVSREERTKEFLKNADVVLLLLYAGRPFDETDHNILFENVRESGIGKLIIGINKYDIAYQNGESTDVITEYVVEQVRKAANKAGDETLKEIISEITPIPISASMSLLSQLPMSKIQSTGEYKHAWERLTDIFEISSQPELRQCSLIDQLFSSINTVITEEKEAILLRKPLNQIMARGEKIKSDLIKSIHQNTQLIENLNAPEKDLDEKLSDLKKLSRRLNLKIESFAIDLSNKSIQIINKEKYKCEDFVDDLQDRIERKIKSVEKKSNFKECLSGIEKETKHTVERDLYRIINDMLQRISQQMIVDSTLFLEETISLFNRHIEDFEIEQVLIPLKTNLKLSCDTESLKNLSLNMKGDVFMKIHEFLKSFQLFPPMLIIDNLFLKKETLKNSMRDTFKNIKEHILQTIDDIFNQLYEERVNVKNLIETTLFTEILTPLTEQIESIINGKINKEEAIKAATAQIEEEKKQLDIIEQQIISIKNSLSNN